MHTNGDREWYFFNARHRTDGPAVTRLGRHNEWWYENVLHRTDGPAVTHEDGTQEWWLNGKYMDKFEHWILANSRETI